MCPAAAQTLADPRSLVVLMIEHEQPEGLSSRKLVVETAKHNVLTAYNAEDGMVLLQRFPNVSLVLVHATLISRHPAMLGEIRSAAPDTPIIVATPELTRSYDGADFVVSSHDPQALLDLLAQEFHIPKAPAER